ncbi:MAG TPA: murein biosynthesis integral membrane protein MurJ [Caulobacteraceae bacterium]
MTAAPVTAAKPLGSGLIRSSMIYSSLTLVSRLMGFARDLVISYAMGASATFAADAFNTAFAFPNLFRRIFAEGAFAAAFVPAYSRALEQDGEEKADVLAGDAMALLAAATLALSTVFALAMPWLMYVIAPGFAKNPDKFHLAIVLTQITIWYLPCMAIYAHLSGVLNARNRFILSAGAPILLNIWTLVTVLPTHTPSGAATMASWGVLAAGVSQAIVLMWGVKKSGAQVHWRLPRITPEIWALVRRAVPGALAASAIQVNIFISGILVSQVNGARSWLAVADRLYQLPLGLVGVAIGVALLPRLSRAVHAKERDVAQGAMDEAVTFAMALTLPAAAALIAIPFFLIDGLYTRGEFTLLDSQQTARALFYYGIGTPAFVLAQLYSRAFFARQDTKSPMIFALVSVVVNIVVGVTLVYWVGFWGIAAATAISSWLNVGQMAFTLGRRGHYQPSAKTWSRLIRILLASVALGLAMALAQHFRPQMQTLFSGFQLGHHLVGAKEVAIVLTCVIGVALYPPLLFAFGGLRLSEVKAALRRRDKTLDQELEEDLGKTPAGPDLL